MVLATDDTSIGVPHEKYFPGSFALYEKYVKALQDDFIRPDGSSGFTAKGVAKEFCGILIDQSNPGCIALDMREVARSIVKATGFEGAHYMAAPGAPNTILSERDCATKDDNDTRRTLLRIVHVSDAYSGSLVAPSLLLSTTWLLSRA